MIELFKIFQDIVVSFSDTGSKLAMLIYKNINEFQSNLANNNEINSNKNILNNSLTQLENK